MASNRQNRLKRKRRALPYEERPLTAHQQYRFAQHAMRYRQLDEVGAEMSDNGVADERAHARFLIKLRGVPVQVIAAAFATLDAPRRSHKKQTVA